MEDNLNEMNSENSPEFTHITVKRQVPPDMAQEPELDDGYLEPEEEAVLEFLRNHFEAHDTDGDPEEAWKILENFVSDADDLAKLFDVAINLILFLISRAGNMTPTDAINLIEKVMLGELE